ncbi:hypothetical protein ACFY7C_26345 [Streptomyces sp. NPDC012769]|uniref:hypothetical protein n=1 Tax=Streptomyces sp. NPDC012769 TaxID=3364848 RepID=UPI0036939ED3
MAKATESKLLAWLILVVLLVGGWFALGFLKDLVFGPGFPHELSHEDAYIFGRVIAEDEGNYADAMMVCASVLTALERDVPDAFGGDGSQADFMDGCTGGGPAKYEVTDSYRTVVHNWMEETPAS